MKEVSKKLIQSIKFPLVFILVLWGIHIFQFVSGGSLGAWGILPQHISGLKGILTAPLIHGDFNHLISNTVPIFVLTTMIIFFYRRIALVSFTLIYFFTGLAVWFFARPVYHIGASGIVYGLISFVFWSGVFRRNIKSIILALIVTVIYSGYLWGVLPLKDGVSWESHLFGAIVGIIVAYIHRKNIEPDEEPVVYSYELEEDSESSYFLDRDTFDPRRPRY